MNKGIQTLLICQQTNNNKNPYFKGISLSNVTDRQLESIRLWPDKQQRAFSALLSLYGTPEAIMRDPNITVTQERIADKGKISISSVIRMLKRAQEEGLLFSWNTGPACKYRLENSFRSLEFLSSLRHYFRNFLFISLALILSKPSLTQADRPLILNDLNLLERTGTSTGPRTATSGAMLYLTDNTWLYSTKETGPKNKKCTLEQFEAKLTGENMEHFTEEQLEQLAQYPKESVKYARQMLTKDMAAGKIITNQFGYVLAISRNHAQKPSKTGIQQPTRHVQAYKESDEEIRARLQDRRERIRVKAAAQGINPAAYTVAELQLLMNGYELMSNAERQQVDKKKPILPYIPHPEEPTRDKNSHVEPVTNWNDMIMIAPVPYIDEQSEWEEVL